MQRSLEHPEERDERPGEGVQGIVSIKQQSLASIQVCTSLVLLFPPHM
jgi:hypothetical protein